MAIFTFGAVQDFLNWTQKERDEERQGPFTESTVYRIEHKNYTTVDPKQVGQQRSIPKSIFWDMGSDIGRQEERQGGRNDQQEGREEGREPKGNRMKTRRTQMTNKKGDKKVAEGAKFHKYCE